MLYHIITSDLRPKYHTEVHVHIFSYQTENYLLVMSMCGTGQMTCRKQEKIFRSSILDAKCCTTLLLQI